MFVKITTMETMPTIQVDDNFTTNEICKVVRRLYGTQTNENLHDWIGDPDDDICKKWDDLPESKSYLFDEVSLEVFLQDSSPARLNEL